MIDQKEYDICGAEILSEYQQIKNIQSKDTIVIFQHIGSFSQNLLISIVSLVEGALIQYGEPLYLQKRLCYLIIECIQNIIFHSDTLPNETPLAYIFITKNKNGYTIFSANPIDNKKIKELENKINGFLNIKTAVLTKLFTNKIKHSKIDKESRSGLGLLTMVSKSGKGFRYEITKASKNYAIFHLELKIKYKISR